MSKEFPVWPIKYHTPSTGNFILLQPFVVAFGSLDDADVAMRIGCPSNNYPVQLWTKGTDLNKKYK